MNAPTPIPAPNAVIVNDWLALPVMLEQTARFMRDAPTLFRMGDRLVYIYRWEIPSEEKETLRIDADALVVDTVDPWKLVEFMTEHVRCAKVIQGNVIPVEPPMKLAKHFMAAKDRWRFRSLKGVIQAPTLRADGTLLAKPGFDVQSGLYLDTGGVIYPTIKDKPTKRDALDALRALKMPFAEFPFVETDDFENPNLSVALSAVLTGLIRRTLPTAPLHVFTAPEAGTGKGLLCNIVSVIVTGNRSAAVTFGHNDDEFKKLLFSALLQNVQVIVIDNIDRPFTGTSLNSALTELELEDRILGVSRTARVPTNALFMANGNNMLVVGDTHRRVVACRMDAGENPEQRRFQQPNLLGYVEQHRPELVAAALTILRAYECAGRPYREDLPEFGSYEDWSHRVRGALVWLGESDPCLSRDQVRAADPEKQGLGLLLHVVHGLNLGWRTAKQLIDGATPEGMEDVGRADEAEAASDQEVRLWDALEGVLPKVTTRLLGEYLSGNKDRVVDGLRLELQYDKHRKINRFRVVRVNDQG